MSSHPLHRPIWNALNSGWKLLAQGDARALRIDPRHGPFAAAADDSPEAQMALAAMARDVAELWIVEPEAPTPPPGTVMLREAVLAQMVAEEMPGEIAPFPLEPVVLTEEDAAEMRALALMTKPGPFLPLTHRLGRFIGIREQGRLIAMAGERMRMPGFAEISGVCTHSDHRGRGHAKRLMQMVGKAILERGETPFLHAYAAHEATVALYRTLGFRVRTHMHMMVIATQAD